MQREQDNKRRTVRLIRTDQDAEHVDHRREHSMNRHPENQPCTCRCHIDDERGENLVVLLSFWAIPAEMPSILA